MPTRDIRTKLTLDGEKEFRQQIAAINQDLRLGNAQLKEAAAAYDLNGDAQERLATQSRILKQQLEQQNQIVQAYENRLKQAKGATDLSAQGMRTYEQRLVQARTKQLQLQKQVQTTDRELEELGRDSRRVGQQLEDNLGGAADNVAKSFGGMTGGMQGMLSAMGISGGMDVVQTVWGGIQSMINFGAAQRPYNVNKARTEYTITESGGNAEEAIALALEMAGAFGSPEEAMQTIAALSVAGYSGAGLRTMSQYLAGAGIKFSGQLDGASLASDLQESIATGAWTGSALELIERLGWDAPTANEAMAAALKADQEAGGGSAQRRQVAESYLRERGLQETYVGFEEQNADLLQADAVDARIADETAELGRTADRLITPFKAVWADTLGSINDFVADPKAALRDAWAAVGVAPENLDKATDATIDAAQDALELQSAIEHTFNPFVMAGQAMAGYDAENLWDYAQRRLGELTTGSRENDWLLATVEAVQPAISQWWTTSRNNLIGAGNLMQGWWQDITTPVADLWRGLTGGPEVSGPRVMMPIDERMQEMLNITEGMPEEGEKGGLGMGAGIVEGLSQYTDQMIAVAEQQRAMLEAVWQDPITPTVVVNYGTGGKPNLPQLPAGTVHVSVDLDGRTVGETVAPYVDVYMGAQGGAGADTRFWDDTR